MALRIASVEIDDTRSSIFSALGWLRIPELHSSGLTVEQIGEAKGLLKGLMALHGYLGDIRFEHTRLNGPWLFGVVKNSDTIVEAQSFEIRMEVVP
jgi:hypothetical protein